MKTFINFILLTCLVGLASGQTTYIVDNNSNAPDGPNVRSTLQDAVDDATDGDFIYVQPSPTTYGTAIVEKELHFVGIGFNLTKDQPHLSTVNNIYLRNNTDNTSNASGSSITGLVINNIYLTRNFNGGSIFTLNDVKIYNNQMTAITWITSTSNTIRVNNMEFYDNQVGTIYFNREITNTIIRNNLVTSQFILDSAVPQTAVISNNILYTSIDKDSEGDNVIIQNNNFIGTNASHAAFNTMIDAIIANNIFYGRTPSTLAGGGSTSTGFQRNIFSNNIVFETGDNTMPPAGGGVGNSGDGNINSSPLFTDVPVLNTWSSSRDFTLQVGSPALLGGTDNTDIGISGGPYPITDPNFQLDTTPLPTIEKFNTSTIINPNDDLDTRIEAKSN